MAPFMCMFFIIYTLFSFPVNADENLETYIVHVGRPQGQVLAADSDDLNSWYASFLPQSTNDVAAADSDRLVHSYRHVASGFAAKLSEKEVKEMSKMKGFVSATPQKKLSLHTTHSPDFLGLVRYFGVWNSTYYGRGVIIGVLDSGITPGHPSFDDSADMPPPPAKWKGKCEFDIPTACNNKLIGARNFINSAPGEPVDDGGHGTHTSSTAAGNFVSGASVFGQANGTAVGAAPRAYLAMYRVCSEAGCSEADVLAGIDAAIDDGVDLISLSLGGPSGAFYTDGISTGTFAAMQKGILVSASAGNNGPGGSSCTNEAPWILTVGASTVDRNIVATAVLGNNLTYDGESLFQPGNFHSDHLLPLIDGNLCTQLLPRFVKGKVVVCARGGGVGRISKGKLVKEAGGAAMILANDIFNANSTIADAHVLPATHVSYDAGVNIRAYIKSTRSPTATITFKGTVIGNKLAPAVASFSSRGPSLASPGILKPDIIGPGVSILAAWSESVDNGTDKRATFNVVSGTSMACPHLTGIAALIKSAHPGWSPAAIKSAIMTTATQTTKGKNGSSIVDEGNLPANIFAVGAGHVYPQAAIDPGLIYDLKPEDYIPYLCGLNYTDNQVQIIVHHPVSCATVKSIPEAQLNYPSFALQLGSTAKTFTRTVTNVGEANSTYDAVIEIHDSAPVGVTVTPAHLSFGKVKQTATFQISFSRKPVPSNRRYVEGALIWRSGWRNVRSPFSIELV